MRHLHQHRSVIQRLAYALIAAMLCAANVLAIKPLHGAASPTVEGAWQRFHQGRYEEAVDYARQGQELDPWITDWELVEARSLLALGRYEEAYQSLESFVSDRAYDLRSRLLLLEAARFAGRESESRQHLDALAFLIGEAPRRYAYDPNDIVAVGEAALLLNVDPKVVLENFFKRAQEESHAPLSAFLATGNLALKKHDYRLASKTFQQGLELYPDNAELWLGLAQSFKEDDPAKMIEYARKSLGNNPQLAGARILIANHLIAAEDYDQAQSHLNQVLTINPSHPIALAYKAIIAHIFNDNEIGEAYRDLALAHWSSNPEVDHIIGRELSRKYRFEQGARSQRSALVYDPSYTPARVQLAQDLLRLGREREAWKLVHEVHESDPYDIVAYNLATLHDKLEDYTTLESENFKLMLAREEAPVYGDRALALLEKAHRALTERYGIDLPRKTIVEIYRDPADFETRTFSMPGHAGFLGVCFGPVFTINSPATRSSNWEAVLYHEFCHTVTLTMTNNRMPRWLSEGISVYEEQRENPAWGQRMSAGYRDRILQNGLQPIDDMSGAFIQAESGEDIQFAYFQSYLVVEYIVSNFGLDALKALLRELGDGADINDALAETLAPLPELDQGFRAFAEAQAATLAPDFHFQTSEDESLAAKALEAVNPQDNYHERLREVRELAGDENWPAVIDRLERLIEQSGYLPGPENAHVLLAQAYRETGQLEEEQALLREVVAREADRVGPITRLAEIAKENNDHPALLRWSDAWLAINPMAPTPWRHLLQAADELGRRQSAIQAAESLIALEPPDTAAIRYTLARQHMPDSPSLAMRHLLLSLEEAPRNLQAYQLLLSVRQEERRAAQQASGAADSLDPLEGLDLPRVSEYR